MQAEKPVPETGTDERDIWERMHAAALAVQCPREISPLVEAGGVAAAVMSETGEIYTGVCVDTASSLGACAERTAVFSLITAGENVVSRVLAIMPDGKVGPPCGACRELIAQVMAGRLEEVQFLISYPEIEIVTLADLMPRWWQ